MGSSWRGSRLQAQTPWPESSGRRLCSPGGLRLTNWRGSRPGWQTSPVYQQTPAGHASAEETASAVVEVEAINVDADSHAPRVDPSLSVTLLRRDCQFRASRPRSRRTRRRSRTRLRRLRVRPARDVAVRDQREGKRARHVVGYADAPSTHVCGDTEVPLCPTGGSALAAILPTTSPTPAS